MDYCARYPAHVDAHAQDRVARALQRPGRQQREFGDTV